RAVRVERAGRVGLGLQVRQFGAQNVLLELIVGDAAGFGVQPQDVREVEKVADVGVRAQVAPAHLEALREPQVKGLCGRQLRRVDLLGGQASNSCPCLRRDYAVAVVDKPCVGKPRCKSEGGKGVETSREGP